MIILCSLFSIGCVNNGDLPERIVKFGVITDIQGDTTNLEFFTNEFNKVEINAILVLGDLNDMNKEIKETDQKEIYSVLKIINENFNKSIYVIPGNHESKDDYRNAIIQVANETFVPIHLHDLSRDGIWSHMGINLVDVPGYHLEEYTNQNGFIIENLENKIVVSERLAPIVNLLVAHGPPLGKNPGSIDALISGVNAGNEQLNFLIKRKNINFGVFGHIHEAGMKAVNREDEFVPENEWSKSLFLNPGPATEWKMNSGEFSKGSAAILEIDINNKLARYEIINVE